ncbi:hypothetical protein PARPLA_03298 [Rhodobacteraceae bacterium THAF1]|uniref:C1 family peptidase n=1 Tax=Palleronia sp. THAF1 TaxID=2587842 RepID=UPI000F3F332A|nr:C1 family peptidase [Palleronia sp. THAF1]QFU10310.1 hypothetical protein FIU81_16635 [Palleronia sp. THAF1]VDC31415.1 hypothetical protein PARPLA_03298 [Rhodobacteraceae bacterium THAF1]
MPHLPNPDTGFRADPTDLRDRVYEPSLRPLAQSSQTALIDRLVRVGGLPYELRHQGAAGTCAGHALANLIDMHRIGALADGAARPPPVSARMLYQMGVQQEQGTAARTARGVTSLRSVIKGFYHNGVCGDALWPDDPRDTDLTVERAVAATRTTLGAYYRVRSYLNDYHAALAEADSILVAASTHAGWRDPEEGVITLRAEPGENHAFVVIGYTDRGFLVLNSHGAEWGGVEVDGHRLKGVALWTYEDWSSHVLDAWVLRLGVPAPDAFTYSHSRRGIFFDDGPIKAGSAPRHQLLGHFAHLDDGDHVTVGSYASTRKSVGLTAGKIAAKPHRPVHVSLPGSLLGIDAAFHAEIDRRPALQAAGVYPYTLFWCNDMVESTSAVLEHLFQTAVKKVGALSENLNDEIEATTAGIGRAFWRDIARAADRAGQHRYMLAQKGIAADADGAAAEMFDQFAATGAPLHLTVDGAGVILLERYLLSLQGADWLHEILEKKKAFLESVASLTLIAPTIRADAFERAFRPLIDRLALRGPERVTLWVPTKGFERKLTVGHYSRSILDLVLYGFEGADKATEHFIGMSAKRFGAEALTQPGGLLEGVTVRSIKTPDHARQPPEARRRRYTQHHVVAHRELQASHLARLADWLTEDAQISKERTDGQDHA